MTADYYVAALPVEVMRTLLSPELRAAEPRLNGLDRLVTRWMNGILFYWRRTCRWSTGTPSTSTPSGR